MRFLFVALFMVLATHVGAQEAQGVTAETPSKQEGNDGKANGTQSNASEPSIPVRIVESPEETQRARDREAASDQHESDDLKAQQEAAQAAGRSATAADGQVNAAWWQVGVGIAGIIALLGTIFLTIRATNAAVRSADLAGAAVEEARKVTNIARETLDHEKRQAGLVGRPFILIDATAAAHNFEDWLHEPIHFEWPFFIQNHGQNPAIIREIKAGVGIADSPPPFEPRGLGPVPGRPETSFRFPPEPDEIGDYPQILAGGARVGPLTWRGGLPLAMPQPDVPTELSEEKALMRQYLRIGDALNVYMVINIRYEDVRGDEKFITDACYRIDSPWGKVFEQGGPEYNRRT